MPIELVLFDMDDVLCAYDIPRRLRELSGMNGRSVEAVHDAIWGSGFEHAADEGAIDAEAYIAGFGARLGRPITRGEWVAARRVAMTPWPEMLARARALADAGRRIAVLSNNGLLTAETIDDLFPGLRPVFGPDIFMSAEFRVTKPQPEVFHGVLARLGVAPERTLFFDDKAENVAGARLAGLDAEVFEGVAGFDAHLARRGIALA